MIVRPIILSGGSGTRMWPVSRKRYPKQFATLVGSESLFAGTLRTVSDRKKFAPPLIIGNTEHKFLILESLERQGIKDATIILEPIGRNTAAAAIVAALAEVEKDSDEIHLVLPSDHVIADKPAFYKAIDTAIPAAQKGAFVLFGITPTHPETGFGYIMPKAAKGPVLPIERFCEKPDEATAKELIAQGALWNSGIFFYRPGALVAEASHLAKAHLDACVEALEKAVWHDRCALLDEESYARMTDRPFDRLIMEKTDKGAVIPCSMGWNDLGSWQALWQVAAKDENGTAKEGPVIAMDVKNSYLRSYGPTVAVLGVEGLAVIATKDSVLVAPVERAQDIKALVAEVGDKNDTLALDHPRVLRPWGSYEGIAKGERFQVKHIIVGPGKALSLQMHHHRAEHWIVVEGTAAVTCDGEEKLVFPNESVYIPGGAKHRLTNPGKVDLHLIEVQSGDYLGEDDIVRFQDDYGRS